MTVENGPCIPILGSAGGVGVHVNQWGQTKCNSEFGDFLSNAWTGISLRMAVTAATINKL
jgi:hypothetical protein